MSDAKKWHECPCGQSIAVSGSEFGQAVLAQWEQQHAAHAERECYDIECREAPWHSGRCAKIAEAERDA